jgi:hypothetical protein
MYTDGPSRGASPSLRPGFEPSRFDFFSRPWIPWTIVGLGIVLRVLAYLHNPSLWLDEAFLAQNLVQRDFAALTRPLDHAQVAPLLFLWAERCVLRVAGSGEMALRFIPFLASCAILPLALWVGRRCLSAGALRIALLLLALSAPLIDYSVQVKPYPLDVVFALLILCVTLRLVQNRDPGRDFLFLGVLGVLAPWTSFPALFVMAAAFAVLLLARGRPAPRRWRVSLGVVLLLWIASDAVFALSTWDWQGRDALRRTWRQYGGFAPFPPRTGTDILWYLRASVRAIGMPGGLQVRSVGILLAALGAAVLAARRHWTVLGLLGLPIGFTLGASALVLYPFADRLILFLAPALTFFAATGLATLWSETARALRVGRARPWSRSRSAGPLLLAAALAATALSIGVECERALRQVRHPIAREEIRELVAILRRDARPDDVVYVYYGAAPAFDYYAPRPAWRVRYGVNARREPQRYAADVDCLAGEPRVWVLLSHVHERGGVSEADLIRARLDRAGRCLAEHGRRGGALLLYDLSPP